MTTPLFNRYAGFACVCGMLVTSVAQTAPGDIANVPLFTATSSGTSAPSNIFFNLDDSGSMDWALLTKHYWPGCLYDPANPVTGTTDCPINVVSELQEGGGFETYTSSTNNGVTTWRVNSISDISKFTSTTIPTEMLYDWRTRSADLNILYYNPQITYVPWKNGDGTSMADASFTAAKDNPYSTATAVNLTNFVFEVWHDTHGYDGTLPFIGTAAATGSTTATTNSSSTTSNTKTSTGTTKSTTSGSTTTKTTPVTVTITKDVTNTTTNTTTGAAKQTINRTTGANGWVDFWDEHTTYTVGASDIKEEYVSYNPANSTTVSTTKAGVPTTSTKTSTATSTPVTTSTSTTTTTTKRGKTITTINVTNTTTTTVTNTTDVITAVNNTGTYPMLLNKTVATTSPALTAGFNDRTLAQEKTNIANWYQYYRQRINVAKGAIGSVIDGNPSYRYGYSTIWNRAFVTVPPASTTTSAAFIAYNKDLLTDSTKGLYRRSPSSGTPLPDAADRVGKYFMHQSVGGTTYTDPIVYECQQNFHILLTDGYWNSNSTSHDDVDGDGHNNTLADVARYYYITDLSSSWTDKVPINNFDTNNKQHLVTYTVAFGLKGNLVDTDGDGWPDPVLAESDDWGNPSTANSGQQPDNIDDLWHAAFNAKGLYVSASSPNEVADGFRKILNNISQRDYAGSATSASFNTSTLNGGNSVYLSQFGLTNNIWSGDVLAYDLAVDGTISTTIKWRAADALAAATARHIFTYNPSNHQGVPFQWSSLSDNTTPSSPTISLAQRDLGTGTSGTVTTGLTTTATDTVNTTAIERLNYLRGDQSLEGSTFRTRAFTDLGGISYKNLLGDIIHSDPILVTAPQGSWPSRSPFPTASGSLYRDFVAAYSTRDPIVYVGANDGMLHAFNANQNGREDMAYIPQTLFSAGTVTTGLHYLTNPSYTHRYYVDGPPVVEDVYIDTQNVGVGSGARWHSVLVGGLMAGGRGIYALDVTDPSLFLEENATNAAKIALWEFNSTVDADMGYSFSVPSIVMMNNGRWAAVFGNGYNNTGSGKAALFIVFLDGGVDGIWTDGTGGTAQDYIKISLTNPSTNPYGTDVITSSDCLNTSSNCNGLSTPQTVDINNDNVVDRIYAGDLKGNMWAFDVSKISVADWKVAYSTGTTTAQAPLFTASHHITPYNTATPPVATGVPAQQRLCNSNTTVCRQPITSRPSVVKNKKSFGSNPPDLLVFFGTGQYLTSLDTGNKEMQGFYGVWDHGVGSLTPATPTASSATTPGFVEQTFLSGPFKDSNGNVITNIRVLTKNAVAYNATTATNHGWFINLSEAAGERQIVNTDVLDEKYLFFNTWIPGTTTSTTNASDLCAVSGNASGKGYLMSVDLFTGGSADTALFDLNGLGGLTDADKVKDAANTAFAPAGQSYDTGLPGSSSIVQGKQYTPGTDTTTIPVEEVPNPTSEKMSRRAWQELRK